MHFMVSLSHFKAKLIDCPVLFMDKLAILMDTYSENGANFKNSDQQKLRLK